MSPADERDSDNANTSLDDGRSQFDRMIAGDLYIADDPRIIAASLRAMALTESYNATPAAESALRRQILEELLGGLGADSEIRAPLQCDYGSNITVGARTFINFGLVALDVASITIGDDVQIGPNVQLLTPTHPIDADLRRAKWEAADPITIGNNVWLGGGVIVLPGVNIGDDTIVGAGSVVSRDLPSGVVALGAPARVTRQL
ncbi:MAG: sugar O-acetyltransferase [Microthrixaceae bacterium]